MQRLACEATSKGFIAAGQVTLPRQLLGHARTQGRGKRLLGLVCQGKQVVSHRERTLRRSGLERIEHFHAVGNRKFEISRRQYFATVLGHQRQADFLPAAIVD